MISCKSFCPVMVACCWSLLCSPNASLGANLAKPIADSGLVFAEKDGLVAVEAEHFIKQDKAGTRAFYRVSKDEQPRISPDGDPPHVAGASGGAYLEILPDTRRTHDDKLIKGENFADNAGDMAVLSYRVHFTTPGRYYVWARAYSTGTEDNGLHVGLDGRWPASGQRMQWTAKQKWFWDSKQRTAKVHGGVPGQLYLDIDRAGEHVISFSMREDGFEFDKWLMTTQHKMPRPEGVGPAPVIHIGEAPTPFELVPVAKRASAPAAASPTRPGGLSMTAQNFPLEKSGYYLDRGSWMAINPSQRKQGKTAAKFPFPSGNYHVTLHAVGENDGGSTYNISIGKVDLGEFKCPLSQDTYEEGPAFNKTWRSLKLNQDDLITVSSAIGSADGQEFSRARWSGLSFKPADAATRLAAKPLLKLKKAAPAAPVAQTTGPTTTPVSSAPLIKPRQADGDATVAITGENKQWHKVTLTLDGPYAHEQDNAPNPFLDYRMTVAFRHESGCLCIPSRATLPRMARRASLPRSLARSGAAHLSPDKPGRWDYRVSFARGKHAAIDEDVKQSTMAKYDGLEGSFEVTPTDKTGRDLRAHGRLAYVGERYLRFAGTGEYFLKAGADAPETLLGYADFDNTIAGKPGKVPLKTWSSHIKDWRPGDPTWQGDKGKGLIGAVNYLSGKGCNAFSFLTYNAGGDGDNVWPFIQRNDKLHYDCSKLDQWGVVFDHGTNRGMYLHFKIQETENDDNQSGPKRGTGTIRESLDGGRLGPQRKLYCRELIARFGHNLALNWNLGEENTQSTEEQKAMLAYIAELDPYGHNRVVHTFPDQQDRIYGALIGGKSALTGLSLQNSAIKDTHSQTVKWVRNTAAAGQPLVVAFDESGSAALGQVPDLGYQGFDGHDKDGKPAYTEHEVRKQTLWGTLMAGGAGVEYYFGYKLAENDLVCEDWRSRDHSWDYCRIALEFFRDNDIPFWEMANHNRLVGNLKDDNSLYCLAKPGELYLVYLPKGQATELDLRNAPGQFAVSWFNPRQGGSLVQGGVKQVSGGKPVELGSPPADDGQDWLTVVRRK